MTFYNSGQSMNMESFAQTESFSDDSDWTTEAAVPGLVSIIIPTFDRIALLTELLISICAQTWSKIEIIVVDDGSADGTVEQLKNWSPTEPGQSFSLLVQANAGPAAARNMGIKRSRGEFLYFIDSDDLIYPHAITTLVEALQNSKDQYCLANIQSVDIETGSENINYREIAVPVLSGTLDTSWMTNAALYRRTAIINSGLFNESLEIIEDSEFQWRVAAVHGHGCKVESVIGLRRRHPFGHLSVGISQFSLDRHSLHALAAFYDWVEANDRITSNLRRDMALRFFCMGIRLGSFGAWTFKDKAFAMIGKLSKYPNIWAIVGIQDGRFNTRIYFKLIWFMIRITRHLLSFKKRFISSPNSEIKSSESK